MRPYYQDDQVTLFHGDCLEITDWLTADVLVTDPPYGMGYESNWNRDKRNVKVGRSVASDKDTTVRDLAIEAWGGRPALVFGKWTCERPNATRARLIWDKRVQGTGDLTIPWGPADEEIYVLGSGFTGKREGTVVSVQMLMSADRERPDHPTPKPIALMERLLEKCPPGVIADPFAGSGSTLVAARNLGRKAIGVELEESYCELIAKRLDQMCLDFGEGA
ncbi:DNA-methyltransferase [Mycolicibacterium peregrinum]|uniref:DNA-methyltransferase n=1 Tax=Mycolicibacterium peregrinum TaxID=43304 RepID=UPI003AAB9C16